MKWFILCLTVLIVGCSAKREVVQILQGDKGDPGKDGVSYACSVQDVEGGLLLSCGDGSEGFLPDGLVGPTGPAGEPGSSEGGATLAKYSGETCMQIFDSGKYVKKNGANYRIYSSSTCSGSALAEVSQGEDYVVDDSTIAFHGGSALYVYRLNLN